MEHRLKKSKSIFFTSFVKLLIAAVLLPLCLNAQAPESRHLAYGIPGKADTIVERTGYALGYIEQHEQAAWVIYVISKNQVLTKNASGIEEFQTLRFLTGNNQSFHDQPSVQSES